MFSPFQLASKEHADAKIKSVLMILINQKQMYLKLQLPTKTQRTIYYSATTNIYLRVYDRLSLHYQLYNLFIPTLLRMHITKENRLLTIPIANYHLLDRKTTPLLWSTITLLPVINHFTFPVVYLELTRPPLPPMCILDRISWN